MKVDEEEREGKEGKEIMCTEFPREQNQLTFPTLENEGNTVPALVANVHHSHGKGRGTRALRNRLVIKVTKLGITLSIRVAHVLPENNFVQGNGLDATKHLDL